MTNSTNNTESQTDSTPNQTQNDSNSGYETNQTDQQPNESQGEQSNLDDYGYEKNPPEKDETKGDEKPKDEKKPDEEPEEEVEPSSGYDKEPKVDEKPKDDDKKPDEENKGDDEGEEKLEDKIDDILGEIDGKEAIKKFALDNNMTKEQVENYVELKKAEDQRLLEENARRIKEIRSNWYKELKNDGEFGGENFDRNIKNVEKILSKFLPNTKKQLTDTKGMLPPYIMKDLLKVHKALNPKTALVNGDPKQVETEESGNFLDEMYK